MKKSVKNLIQLMEVSVDGKMKGGFLNVRGGLRAFDMPSTNLSKCPNEKTCTGTNKADCTNSVTCTDTTNTTGCHNSGACFS